MIRTLLTTTALVAFMSGSALAQAAVTATPDMAGGVLAKGYMATDKDNLATEIIGKQVYSSAAMDAEHIGDVNNLVIGDDGAVAAVIIGVGGFLGIGEKNVAVSMDELQWVAAEDNTWRYVLATTKEALNSAPSFEWTDDEPMDTAAAPMQGDDAMAVDQTATGTAAPADNMVAAPAAGTRMDPLNRNGLTDFDESKLTAEELIGTNVYGTNDEHIGAIGDLALNEDGTIDAIIIDFGGFLGIGTKPVAVAFENLDFLADPNNNRSLVLPITREQMEAAPAFNKDTYTAERDTQRFVLDKQS
jgi:sporulation protein YlmC with PRC-barrel domain